MPAWPATLLPGVSESSGVAVLAPRTEVVMETGRTRVRPVSTTGRRAFSVKWDLSDQQLELFQGWFEHTLESGTLAFTLELPTGHANLLETVSAQFKDAGYQTKAKGPFRWNVTAVLLVEGVSGLTAEQYAALTA